MGRRILFSFTFVMTSLLSGVSGGSGALAQSGGNGLEGNVYSDPNWGFVIEWEDGAWVAEEVIDDNGDPRGVYLTNDSATGSLSVAGYDDTEECLADRLDRLDQVEGVTNLDETTTVEMPEFARDTNVLIVQYDYENPTSGDVGEFTTVYGCEVLPIDGEPQAGVVFTHDYGDTADQFETSVENWVQVVDGVAFAGGDSPSPDPDNVSTDGGLYVDPNYHFSVAWDENEYESEILLDGDVPYGVNLSNDPSRGSIWVGLYSTPRSCVNDQVDFYENLEGVTDFEEADDLILPETDPDARFGLYRFNLLAADSEEAVEYVQYFECRDLLFDGEPADDVVLVIEFGAFANDYEDTVPGWEATIASVTWDVGSGSSSGTPTRAPGVDGNSYLDPFGGWTATWDESDLEGTNWEDEDSGDILGLRLTSDLGGFMTIFTKEANSPRSCLNAQVESIEGDGFVGFEEVEDVDLPETSDESRAALYQGVFISTDESETDIYFYAECQPMIADGEEVEDMYVVVNIITATDVYVDELPIWSNVLTSIEFGGGTGTDPGPDPDPTVEVASGGIDGSTYTSAIGYSLSWDDSIYTAELLNEGSDDGGVVLSSDLSIITIQAAADPTLAACVDAEEGIVEGQEGMSSLSRERTADAPEGGADSGTAFLEGTVTFEDGGESPVYVYIECRPLGFELDGNPMAVVIRMLSLQEGYEDELPRWQEILDSIELIGG